MGWTGYYRAPGERDRDHLQRELFGTGSVAQILDGATVRGTFYAAVRTAETGEVWALIVLQRRTRGACNYYRKEMDEGMGPNEDGCPDHILDLLTPTDSEWANEWRKRCRDRNAAVRNQPKVKPGDVIALGRELTFSDGVTEQRFRFVQRSKFQRVSDGRLVSIPSWRQRYAYQLQED